MKTVKLLAILGLFAAAGCGSIFSRRGDLGTPCGKQHPLEVVSLTFFPDPLPEARRIDQWRAVIRSDSTETCRVNIQIVEKNGDKPAMPLYTVHLAVGNNAVLMNSIAEYRLAGGEVCFQVLAEIDGTKSPLRGPERSCARAIDKGLFSMR